MSLKGIISISGKGGLYQVVAQGKNNVIVKSIEDGRKFPAFASSKISALDDISIYTVEEDVLLNEVYKKMYDHLKGKEALDHKEDIDKLRKSFKEVLPEYDEERVTNTDVKKLFQWYNILIKADLLKFEEEVSEEKTAKTEKATAKPKAKAKAKPKKATSEEE
jgi:hypothetical protein